MADDALPIEALEDLITRISDTQSNVEGLVQKTAGIQGDLMNAKRDDDVRRAGEVFSELSNAAEKLQALGHDLEIERNRRRNEAD